MTGLLGEVGGSGRKRVFGDNLPKSFPKQMESSHILNLRDTALVLKTSASKSRLYIGV